MKIGIGVPTTIEGVSGDLLLEWARRADASGFSSLSFIDRIADLDQVERLREVV